MIFNYCPLCHSQLVQRTKVYFSCEKSIHFGIMFNSHAKLLHSCNFHIKDKDTTYLINNWPKIDLGSFPSKDTCRIDFLNDIEENSIYLYFIPAWDFSSEQILLNQVKTFLTFQ